MKPNDLVGKVFGRLTVMELAPRSGKKGRMWACQCECGAAKAVRTDHLTRGLVVSCGCYWAQRRVEANTTHGLSNSRVYRIWKAMCNRCHYEKYPERHLYGGRGITVCDRWRNSFENFVADMGIPADHLSIDRIDVNGNYEPGNCRWATELEQAHNKRPKSELGVTFYDLWEEK